jgi:glycosyltransferase involved in cell wall biosynthesis
VCSSSGWAHAIRTTGKKVVYCHSPAKWLYRRNDYLGEQPSTAARAALAVLDPLLRRYDRRGAESADAYVANSAFIASQIRDTYGIEARVVHPPPGVTPGGTEREVRGLEPGFVLTVSRLLPYKNVSALAQAFRRLPEMTLVIVGDGPERFRIIAGSPMNVRVLGEVDDETLRWLYANCAGLVAASREDFGLTPLEAATFGKPTAALRWGGFLDTVADDVSGVLFDEVDPNEIADAVQRLFDGRWDTDAVRAHAARFSEERFAEQMREVVAGVTGA